jgi:hypothetical protein
LAVHEPGVSPTAFDVDTSFWTLCVVKISHLRCLQGQGFHPK